MWGNVRGGGGPRFARATVAGRKVGGGRVERSLCSRHGGGEAPMWVGGVGGSVAAEVAPAVEVTAAFEGVLYVVGEGREEVVAGEGFDGID